MVLVPGTNVLPVGAKNLNTETTRGRGFNIAPGVWGPPVEKTLELDNGRIPLLIFSVISQNNTEQSCVVVLVQLLRLYSDHSVLEYLYWYKYLYKYNCTAITSSGAWAPPVEKTLKRYNEPISLLLFSVISQYLSLYLYKCSCSVDRVERELQIRSYKYSS